MSGVQRYELNPKACDDPDESPMTPSPSGSYVGFDHHTAALAAKDAEIERITEQKDGAYTERNALVAALSKLLPACLARHPAEDLEWDDDWRWIVFIDAPTGQLSWHIHDSEREAFDHLEVRDVRWDGHTTPEKYKRLAALEGPPEIECESCRADFLGDREDSTCGGCGAVICQSCSDVFDHFGDGLHGKGDPTAEVERLRVNREVLAWYANDKNWHARVCDHGRRARAALAPRADGGEG